jgi:Domain of unknown function (DUF4262)
MSLKGKPQADPFDQSYLDKIEAYGHAVMAVKSAADDMSGEPDFSYSTGAYESYRQPELIIFGLAAEMRHWLINEFYVRLTNGEQFALGKEVEDFLEGYPVIFVEVGERAAREYMNFTRWYYDGEHFPVWQMVWPDVKSRMFPWDEACPAHLIAAQPDLSATGFASMGRL